MSEFPNTPQGRADAAKAGMGWSGDQAVIKLPDKKQAEKLKEAFAGMSSFAAVGADKITAMAKGLELAGPALEIFNTFVEAWVAYFQGLVDWQLVVDIFQTLYETAKPLAELLATGVNAAFQELNKEMEEAKPLLNELAWAFSEINSEVGPLIESLRELEEQIESLAGTTNMGAYGKMRRGQFPTPGRGSFYDRTIGGGSPQATLGRIVKNILG
jgi:hypothetical protein